jgi:hypothetical protein
MASSRVERLPMFVCADYRRLNALEGQIERIDNTSITRNAPLFAFLLLLSR